MTAEQTTYPPVSLRSQIPFWRDERVLRILAQVVSAIMITGFVVWMVRNVIITAQQRGLSLGFRFLTQSAGFPIGESLIPYDPSMSFAYAFFVGVLNTLYVSSLGIIFATILGVFAGIARLSSNWLVSKLAQVYIEVHRNIPLLVLLYLWHSAVFLQLPRVQESIVWPGPVYLNQRGLYMTWPRLTETGQPFVIGFAAGLILAAVVWVLLSRLQTARGGNTHYVLISLVVLAVCTAAGWIISGGNPIALDVPELRGFNFRGGMHLSPEFAALLVGLVTYTSAFIADVVRAGIQAVPRGQVEAARALGLNYRQALSLVIMPQALRVIIPPLISQYLNLTKNSSLAAFIGFTELFFIGKTTINQAGRALQVILLVMAVYLVISLFTSLIMNLYNRRVQFVER